MFKCIPIKSEDISGVPLFKDMVYAFCFRIPLINLQLEVITLKADKLKGH